MPVYTKLFGVFVLIVVTTYYSLSFLNISKKWKATFSKSLLLIFSFLFYAYAGIQFLPFLVFISASTYILGVVISRHNSQRVFLGAAIFLLLPLVILKTMDWIDVPGAFLPLGCSFVSLQAFTYLYSVYKGELPVADFLSVSLFVSFFPTVTSGPIVRAKKVIPQLQSYHEFDYGEFTDGMKLIAWGLLKKLVLADNMAKYISNVNIETFEYGNVSGTALLLTSVLYSFQLYLDFSGYSDIVIGCAKMLGFKIDKNFDHPYLARTISDFWKGWHISLSSWLRDYIYFPLGGSRTKEILIYRNLMVVFIISGLWHGNGATFIVWGLLHGLFSCMDRFVRKRTAFNGSMILTFSAVTFAWIFFAASSVENALFVIKSFAKIPCEIQDFFGGTLNMQDMLLVPNDYNIMLLLVGLILFICISLITRKKEGLLIINEMNTITRWILYFAVILCVLFFASSDPVNFIYNRF